MYDIRAKLGVSNPGLKLEERAVAALNTRASASMTIGHNSVNPLLPGEGLSRARNDLSMKWPIL
jgi:hypothetical protein